MRPHRVIIMAWVGVLCTAAVSDEPAQSDPAAPAELRVEDFRFDGALGSEGAAIEQVAVNHFRVTLGAAPEHADWANKLQFQIVRHACGNGLRIDVAFEGGTAYPFDEYFCSWSYDGADWRPIHWEKDPKQRGDYNTLVFPEFSEDTVYCGHQVPMSYEDLDALIARWQASPFVRVHILGRSLGGRNVYRLEITDPESPYPPGSRWVHYFANQHPGEHNALWRMVGMIDWLLSDAGADCRRRSICHFIPMTSPDAPSHGWYRVNAQGVDMNRSYCVEGADASQQAHEAFLVQKDLEALMRSESPVTDVWSMHTWPGPVEPILIPGPEIGSSAGPWTAFQDIMQRNATEDLIEPLRVDEKVDHPTYWSDGPHLQFGVTAVLCEGGGALYTKEENTASGAALMKSISDYYAGTRPPPLFEAVVRVRLEEDCGQPLGSLFEARDQEGRVLFGAGFADSHSTYVRDNNRLLSFYHKDPSSRFELERIDKPFDPDHNAVRLIHDGENLLAFFRFCNPVQLLRLSKEAVWQPFDAPWASDCLRFGGLQVVDNRRMVFEARRVRFDDRVVYEGGQGGPSYYVDGRLFIFCDKPQRLYVCDWSPEHPGPVALDNAQRLDIEGYPFVFGTYHGEIVVATNIGNVYVYRDGGLRRIRASDGTSWQAYSMLTLYDEMLIGHYPTGSLFTYSRDGLELFDPPIPVPSNASPHAREAQTLAIYCGDLYAGVWPWGELWRFDPDERSWEFVARVFDDPEVTKDVQEPFAEEMAGKSDVYNYWGQRIVSLVPYGDSLYIGTMNKGGGAFKPAEHGFIDGDTLAQYGRAFRLKRNAQVVGPFVWREETEFRFLCDQTRLAVYQDGRLLATTRRAGPALGGRGAVNVSWGTGVYGDFAGAIVTASKRAR